MAQETVVDTTFVDSNYREDQFYISVTYNLLQSKPDGMSQRGFSSGFHFGFIRDMPINEKRNIAFGIGLGLSSNSYNQNMLIFQDETNDYVYEIINEDEVSIDRNKLTTYMVELPIEFRWRTSTASEYKFWRIYTGVKLGYVFMNSSKYKGSLSTIKNTNIDDINALQYGLTLSAGYSTWNFHVYYGLNPIFKDSATLNGEAMDASTIKIGLMFYIL
uniref:porin family protein n=1 Tax=Gelidibacter sp. TaxID=2018083 RepID=UPI00404A3F34